MTPGIKANGRVDFVAGVALKVPLGEQVASKTQALNIDIESLLFLCSLVGPKHVLLSAWTWSMISVRGRERSLKSSETENKHEARNDTLYILQSLRRHRLLSSQ